MTESEAAELYLDLMKRCLTRLAFPDRYYPILQPTAANSRISRAAHLLLAPVWKRLRLSLYRRGKFDAGRRAEGRDWPAEAETMIGLARLDNLQACVTDVLRDGVPGDLIEAGAWRGGAAIFLRAILKAYGDRARRVWVADSFAGLPRSDGRYVEDRGDPHWLFRSVLGVPLDEVKANFARYGLLDEQVRFLPGWFKDTLPRAPIERLAVLRVDGDMYSSTMDVLEALYPRVESGGYVIIDDYSLPSCRRAVEDYRATHEIREEIRAIDWTGVFWRKRSLRSFAV